MFLIPIAIAAPMMYGLARGFGTSLLRADARRAGPRPRPRPADHLAGTSRARTGRAAGGGPAHPRGRLRPGSLGGPARLAFRTRQPPGIPGGDGARVGDGDPPQPDARAGDPRPRRLQEDQRLARPRGRRQRHPRGRDDDRDLPPPQRPGVPHRWRRVRDHHARDRRRARHARGPPAPRRLPGRGGRRQPDGHLVLGRGQRDPGPGARPRLALRPGRCGPGLGQASRPDVRDHLRRRAPPRHRRHPPAGRAVRAGRPSRGDRSDPRGLPADLRPDHRCPARVRGPRPAAPRQRLRRRRIDVRGGRGDRPDRRARPRLPEHGDGDGRPAAPPGLADDQPLAADDGDRRVQRPRACCGC